MSHLHRAAVKGNIEVIKLLVEAGASLSAVDKWVIKPSVKLRQANIKLCKYHMSNVIKNEESEIFDMSCDIRF